MSEFEEITKQIIDFRDARDWKQFHNPKDLSLSLVLEVAELIEHFQWKDKDEIDEHIKKNKEDISDEMADVLYFLLVLAHDLDINLVEAVRRKIQKNNAKYPVEKSKGNHKKYTEL